MQLSSAMMLQDDQDLRSLLGGAFVAVGALHLPGPEGLLKLLEEKGLEVSPIY